MMLKTWNQLFTRSGWILEEQGKNTFDCKKETEENLQFLQACLEKADVQYVLKNRELMIVQELMDESNWIRAVEKAAKERRDTAYYFNPEYDELEICHLDLYMMGTVRQLNRLGFSTTLSCDGHDRRFPIIYLMKDIDIDLLTSILRLFGIPRVSFYEMRNHYKLSLRIKRSQLLDLAEQLSNLHSEWLEQGIEYIERQLLNQEIEQCLSIPGSSGEEDVIRKVVREKMKPYVDYITVDHYGNLLAEKTYGNGNGPTILLNAHLDTVYEIEPGRTIQKNGTIWTSSEGILGADDRAGVAIIVMIAKHLNQSDFCGKVKFIFTVEEEIGLVGAQHVDEYFLWGVDAAIVLDRRGNSDIVTSCGGIIPFCSSQYGLFFEQVAKEIGLVGWACREGGSSDTGVWASHGIESVNLSVGYGNEHTAQEFLDVQATYQTYTLLKGIFQKGRELRRTLRNISTMRCAQ